MTETSRPPTKRRLLAVLAALPGDEPFRLLLDRSVVKYVPAALMDAADRFPVRALRLLAGSSRRGAGDLLRTHVLAHPAMVDRTVPTLSDDAAGRIRAILTQTSAIADVTTEALPALLASPPWTAERPAAQPWSTAGVQNALDCDLPGGVVLTVDL